MRKLLVILLISLTLVGCAPMDAVAGSSGTQLVVVALPDPSFGGMVATFVAVPAGWQVEGRMSSNQCTNLPDPAWTATSPDGKSDFSVLPKFGWRLGNGVRYGQGCDPLTGTPSAADFLKLFAAKLPGNVRVVAGMPVAPAYRHREDNFTAMANENNQRLTPVLRSRSFGDTAAVRAVDDSGREIRLRAWVQCRQNQQGGDCFAKVDVLRAPKGRLEDLVAVIDNQNLAQEVPAVDWLTAYQNRQRHIAAGQFKSLTEMEDAGNHALRQQYLDSSARLKSEHEAGMQQTARATAGSMKAAGDVANARSTAASDWRDYAADQQTVSGANGTYKTSSQYTNVWSSPYGPALSNGRSFGATDNTLDPNTPTDNTWTQDHKVHGNGQPY